MPVLSKLACVESLPLLALIIYDQRLLGIFATLVCRHFESITSPSSGVWTTSAPTALRLLLQPVRS